MSKPKLFISFSGGRSSAYMTERIMSEMSEKYEIMIIFANTGQERDETLDFVNECDKAYGWGVVWVEAKVKHGERKGSGHVVVTYDTACRNGEVFEDVIVKYGIPNKAYPHCTRELKLNPMYSYLRSIGWHRGEYQTAIGIRADEKRRVSKKQVADRIVYPMIDWFVTDKSDVNDFWADKTFNLRLQEHEGNCSWCWKKSFKKLHRLARENRQIFEFPATMEGRYGLNGHNIDGNPRVFFRGNTSTRELLSVVDMIPDEGVTRSFSDGDENSGCSESCEIFN